MKRIIDGVTYNTDTATLIATKEYDWEEWDGANGLTWYHHARGELYQSRGGAFFDVDTELWRQCEVSDPERVVNETPRFGVLTRDQAEKWIERGVVELIDTNVFQHPPESASGIEPAATLYVRVPRTLKDRIEALAKEAGCSINTWVMRCVERCASS